MQRGQRGIAELASCGWYFAMKNLLRRRVLTAEEILKTYDDRDVFDFLHEQDNTGLMEEIRYYLVGRFFIATPFILPFQT